ncbi:MAG: amino acid ABC transporter substrate-binding protein, partial [Actinomycetia bacterium]|nr:amino acid ABC transporter substrate-binding protein [Actinomycetes bacterium]
QRWAEQRQVIVERAVTEGWGVGDDNVLRGPGGLNVDLNDCPAGWDPAAGVTDDTVEIVMVATTQGLGVFPHTPVIDQERIDRVNQAGGIGGRDLELTHRDDGFLPQFTVNHINETLAGPQPLAVSTYGSRPTVAVTRLLENACVPNLLANTFHDSLTTSLWAPPFGMTIGAETALWGQALTGPAGPNPLRVAAVVMDNDLGWLIHDAFAHWATHQPNVIAEVIPITHDQTAQTLDDQITDVIDADPDVVIAATAGHPCSLLTQSEELAALDLVAAILPSFCDDPSAYLTPGGDTAHGWLSVPRPGAGGERGGAPEPLYQQWVTNELTALGYDPSFNGWAAGLADYGWLQTQILTLASELPGGLNRPNLLLAMWAADFEHPSLGPDIPWRLNGPADPVPVESGMLRQWNATTQQWDDLHLLTNEDHAPHCTWNGQRCTFHNGTPSHTARPISRERPPPIAGTVMAGAEG